MMSSQLVQNTYGIRRAVIGRHPFLQLPRAEADGLCAAMSVGWEAVDLEEKLDIAIGNYFSLEELLIRITLRHTIYTELEFNQFQLNRSTINRHVMNTLTACRFYRDTVIGNLRRILGPNSAPTSELENFIETQWNSAFAWRLIESLRNHAQHAALPITGVTYSGHWLDKDHQKPRTGEDLYRRVQNISLHLSIEELRKNRSFDKGVLAELSKLTPAPDLKHVIREYIDVIREIHERARALVTPRVVSDETRIVEILDRYLAIDNVTSDAGVAVVFATSENSYEKVTYLSREPFKYMNFLRTKNGRAGKYARAYVSSETTDE